MVNVTGAVRVAGLGPEPAAAKRAAPAGVAMAARPRAPLRSSARLSTAGPERAAPAGQAGQAGQARQARLALERRREAAERRARAAERAREVEDSPRELRDKCRRLARALQRAKHLVVYTGAGISTAADIPDYRGPRGVWTRLQRGESVGRVEVARARPTYTHMALTALWARGALKFVVSQNCDGLHVRAGLPRRALAELHGDMFAERCAACRRVYLRAFDTTERTARHAHATRRLCHKCGRELADTIVHFGERGRAAWPLNWAGALRHAAAADVVLCLGSSLKVLRRYPRLWRMHRAPHARPKLYIVNLQWTPKDSVAELKINARCDAVMAQVARRLRLRVPRYEPRRDPLLAHAEPLAPPEVHTTRRAPLSPPPPFDPAAPPAFYEDRSSSPASASATSASDSDDDVPLRRLAERMRAPAPPAPPAPPPPGLLHAFQVSMREGDATILLRAEHAPSVRPARPPSPAAPPGPAALGAVPPAPRRPLSELRRFRIARRPLVAPPLVAPPTLNGRGPSPGASLGAPLDVPPTKLGRETNGGEPEAKPKPSGNGAWALGSRLRHLLECEPRVPEFGAKFEPKLEAEFEPKLEAKFEPKLAAKLEPKSEEEREARAAAEASALAAAIIARAVLFCRASLYPGLHTIIAPGAAAAGEASAAGGPAAGGAEGAQCAWCLRAFRARRCLWYGPPRAPPAEARAWRRVRGRRYLCACCGPGAPPPDEPGPGPAAGAGWYGKGYRKGRRRRR